MPEQIPANVPRDPLTTLRATLAIAGDTLQVETPVVAELAAMAAEFRVRIGEEPTVEYVKVTSTAGAGAGDFAIDRAAEDAAQHPAREWPAGTPIRMLLTQDGLQALLDESATPATPAATTAVLGKVKMATAPTDPASPIAVGDNDPRNSNARTPTAHEHDDLRSPDGTSASVVATDETAPGADDGGVSITAGMNGAATMGNGVANVTAGPTGINLNAPIIVAGGLIEGYAGHIPIEYDGYVIDETSNANAYTVAPDTAGRVIALAPPANPDLSTTRFLFNTGGYPVQIGGDADNGGGGTSTMFGGLDTILYGEGRAYFYEPSSLRWIPIREAGRIAGTTTEITANGSYTVPDGVTKIRVEMVGGGGGGGGASGTAAQAAVGGGGGSGAYAEAIINVTAGTVITVDIGSGASGGNTSGSSGSSGGTTRLTNAGTAQVLAEAKGGSGGTGMATGTTPLTVAGGSPGEIDNPLSTGSTSVRGAGNPGQPGLRFSATIAISGTGGASAFGRGGSGRNADGTGTAASSTASSQGGNNPVAYGGGGGGGCSLGATGRAGGAGRQGFVRITPIT
jgi:hypothetical protein